MVIMVTAIAASALDEDQKTCTRDCKHSSYELIMEMRGDWKISFNLFKYDRLLSLLIDMLFIAMDASGVCKDDVQIRCKWLDTK